MNRRGVLVALALVVASATEARALAGSWCVISLQRVGPCQRVHGRLMVYNGNPTFRIWIVGTHRLLGLAGRSWRETESGDMLPSPLRRVVGAAGFSTVVFADFDICLLERQRRGVMQKVCIAGASRLRVTRPPT